METTLRSPLKLWMVEKEPQDGGGCLVPVWDDVEAGAEEGSTLPWRALAVILVPDEFRGRVMALWGMTHSSVRPVGEMQFAVVAALTTASLALVVGGLAVIAFILLVALPNRNLRGLNITKAHAARTEGVDHRG